MNMPSALTYDNEMKFMPWGRLLDLIVAILSSELHSGAKVVDLMCGTGYLLRSLLSTRTDLDLGGVDINPDFIKFANDACPSGINWSALDVIYFKGEFDCAICTGSIHHLDFDDQEKFIKQMTSLISSDGICVIADTCLSPYSSDLQRKLAIQELDCAYLKEIIKAGASQDVIDEMVKVLARDLSGEEYKTSLTDLLCMIRKAFDEVLVIKCWPDESVHYGDYIILAKSPKRRNLNEQR